jgi:hypothetical protein
VSIETEHHGYKIVYSENEDRWRCWEMECDGKSLSAVKAKVAAILSATRKIEPAPAVTLRSWGGLQNVMLLGWASAQKVWVMDGRRRTQENASNVAMMTPETLSALSRVDALQKQADALRADIARILDSIPRVQPPEGAKFPADGGEER